LAFEVSQASKAQREALEVEAQEDSQAPRGMWGPQGQRGPQGLQDPQGLRENQGLLGRQGPRASGGPWGLKVNQGSRGPLESQGPQAHQEARAATKGPSPGHCYTGWQEGPQGRASPPASHTYRQLWSFDPKGASPWACPCTSGLPSPDCTIESSPSHTRAHTHVHAHNVSLPPSGANQASLAGQEERAGGDAPSPVTEPAREVATLGGRS